MLKISKRDGIQSRYDNVLFYQWKFVFEDGNIMTMFTSLGNEIRIGNAIDYHNKISNVKTSSWIPFTDTTRKIINNNKSHSILVQSSNNPIHEINITNNKFPYLRRRMTNINKKINIIYIIGNDNKLENFKFINKSGNYILTNNRFGEWTQ